MQHKLIPEERLVVQIFDSPQEVAKIARMEMEDMKGREGVHTFRVECYSQSSWIGRDGFHSWRDVERAASETWPEGLQRIERMRSAIESAELPVPKARRRKMRWSENDGDLCVDRLLDGNERFLRESYKSTGFALQHCTLLFNPCGSAAHDAESLAWRGAAASIVSDILETAGFQVEVWSWFISRECYEIYATPNAMQLIQVKEAGAPLDQNTMANAGSPWFFRTAALSSLFHKRPASVDEGIGYCDYDWGDRKKHIPLAPGSLILEMPSQCFSEREAIAAARQLLENIETESFA